MATGTADYRAVLTKLKAKNPESIFINPQAEAGFMSILKQIHQLQWMVPIYGTYFAGSPALLSAAGSVAEGVIYADGPVLDNILTPEGREMMKEFKAKYGEIRSIEISFASAFEGFHALDSAVRSGEDVRSYLLSKKIKGIFGEYSFDAKGEMQGIEFVLKKIEGGKPVLLK
jgi:ABC-type branched-subunit amino acid transport system substrate-binding protein